MSNFLTDFTVNEAGNTLTVSRKFAANINLVWDAWTKAEILDQWWAPLPYKAKTKSQVFEPNGHWHYAMVGPNNDTHWGMMQYKEIAKPDFFSANDVFCDENGATNSNLPSTDFVIKFTIEGDITMVNMVSEYATKEALEEILAMGMKEGLSMALAQLDSILAAAN